MWLGSGRLAGMVGHGGRLGRLPEGKVNIMPGQNAQFVQQIGNLWAHQYRIVTSARTEFGGTSNKQFFCAYVALAGSVSGR